MNPWNRHRQNAEILHAEWWITKYFNLNVPQHGLETAILFFSTSLFDQITKRNSTRWLINCESLVEIKIFLFWNVIRHADWLNISTSRWPGTIRRTVRVCWPAILKRAISNNLVHPASYVVNPQQRLLVWKPLLYSFHWIASSAKWLIPRKLIAFRTKRVAIAGWTFISFYSSLQWH